MKKGFTLIELLVVVLIIGILASIAFPQYQKAVDKARVAEVVLFVNNAKRAVQLYTIQNGFPNSRINLLLEDVLDVDLRQGMDCSNLDTCQGKYFDYGIRCDGASCGISAYMNNNNGNYVGLWMYTSDGVTWDVPQILYYVPEAEKICQVMARELQGKCEPK